MRQRRFLGPFLDGFFEGVGVGLVLTAIVLGAEYLLQRIGA